MKPYKNAWEQCRVDKWCSKNSTYDNAPWNHGICGKGTICCIEIKIKCYINIQATLVKKAIIFFHLQLWYRVGMVPYLHPVVFVPGIITLPPNHGAMEVAITIMKLKLVQNVSMIS